MKNSIIGYVDLLSDFKHGRIGVVDFQRAYINKFKAEKIELDESAFELLDRLFGDVDSYTEDVDLLNENPDFYLDEKKLREKVDHVLCLLGSSK